MFIHSKRSIIIPAPDGSKAFLIKRDFVGTVPDWVAETKYFAQNVRAGIITVTKTEEPETPAPELDGDSDNAAGENKDADESTAEEATEEVKKPRASRKSKAE